MNRAGSLTYAAAVVALLLLARQDTLNGVLFLQDFHKPDSLPLTLAGWAVTTFGPLILSVCCWLLVKRVRARWALHLLFIPCAIALMIGGSELLISASGLISDGPIGSLMFAGGLLLILTVLIHAVALIVELIRMLGRPTEARQGRRRQP